MTTVTFRPAFVLPNDLAKYARSKSGNGRPPRFSKCYAMAQRGWITGRGEVTDLGGMILGLGCVIEVTEQLFTKLSYARLNGHERSPKLRSLGMLDDDFKITELGSWCLDIIDNLVTSNEVLR